MRTLNCHGLYLLGAPLLVALSIAIISGAPAKSDPKANVRTAVIASSAKPKSSPPHAGVRLLEDILNKMREKPQLAMKNKQGLMKQQQIAADDSGATDQYLAIKPKERSNVALARDGKSKDVAQKIAILPPKGGFYQQQAQSFPPGGAPPMNLIRGNTAGDNFYSPPESRARQESKAAPAAEGAAYDQRQLANNPIANLRNALTAVSGSMAKMGSNVASAPALPQTSMGGRVDRTSQTTRLIAQKQSDKDVASPAPSAVPSQSATRGTVGGRFAFAPNSWQLNSPRRAGSNANVYEYNSGFNSSGSQTASAEQQFVPPPRMQSAASGAAGGQGYAGGLAGTSNFAGPAEADVIAARPPQPVSAYRTTREYGNFKDAEKSAGDELQEEAQTEQHSKRKSEKESAKKTLVALLPPSVVTGIPLIRLGISESEAGSGLASVGSLNKENISQWSVWSLQRPGSKDTSLQVYIKNCRVEAIRIFDPTLIAPDFGVKLGDELATVKQKFGEPAFIMREPTAQAGQNYVYPISQVSFQLSRIGANPKPQVVSLLIFNVQ